MKNHKISEIEFRKICDEIYQDRKIILKHNPIGGEEETLFWMLMSVLISFLSIEESQMPDFHGKPDADTYRDAILFILKNRKKDDFEEQQYLRDLVK